MLRKIYTHHKQSLPLKLMSKQSKGKQIKLSFSTNPTATGTDPNNVLLDDLQNLIDSLNSTNSATEKVTILKDHPQFKELIKLVYDPLKPFHVTSTTVKKFISSGKKVDPKEFTDVIDMLNALASRKITGHEALSSVGMWIKKYPQHKELLYKIIDKDLKIRMGAKQINKAFKDLIPLFEVALGHPIEKYPNELNDGEWRISRKLDGVRCLAVCDSDCNINFYSRQGNEFLSLEKLEDALKRHIYPLFPDGFVLDGEVCVIDSNGSENFKDVMKEIRKKNHQMKSPRYILFDCLTLDEFLKRESDRTFSERLNDLEQIRAKAAAIPEIQVIEQLVYTPERLTEMNNLAEQKGWEGLIVRKDVKYEGKRTKHILKVKKFQTEEYRVVDIETGPFQAHNPDTGLTETIDTMVSVTILHKNYPVSVGSGFSVAERKKFYDDPDLIKGKIISVQYFEETTDQSGGLSLRFPTFKGLYGTTRTI